MHAGTKMHSQSRFGHVVVLRLAMRNATGRPTAHQKQLFVASSLCLPTNFHDVRRNATMAATRSFLLLLFSTFAIGSGARLAAPPHRHRDVVAKRQNVDGDAPAATTDPGAVITYITPSPDATPIAVTEQGQLVTSYVPEYTLCDIPGLVQFSIPPVPTTLHPTAIPYGNFSLSTTDESGTCTTIYNPTPTYVCKTTLTGLFDMYTVSECDQEITFSTQYGYVLVTPTPEASESLLGFNSTMPVAAAIESDVPDSPEEFDAESAGESQDASSDLPTVTPADEVEELPGSSESDGLDDVEMAEFLSELSPPLTENPVEGTAVLQARQEMVTPGPSIETLTTYFIADWHQLTAGTVPSDVDLKVCRTFTNGTVKCVRELELWEVGLATMTTTSVTSVNISTTVHGASQIIVATYVANVTELVTTFSLSTTMAVEYTTEYTSTRTGTRLPSPTQTLTQTLVWASTPAELLTPPPTSATA